MIDFDVFTKDPNIAKKLLIGSLLVLTGVGTFALMGWTLEIMRRVLRGEPPSLPEFDDIGTLFIDGLKMMAIMAVWALPLAVLVVVLAAVIIFVMAGSSDPQSSANVAILINLCTVGLVFVFLAVLYVLLGPASGYLAETGDVKGALDPRRALAIFRKHPGGFLVATLLWGAVSGLLGSVGAILCLVGIYPATVILYALQGQFFGNAYREYKEKDGAIAA